MQTQVRAPAEASKQQDQSAQKPAQLLAEPKTVFEDARAESAQLKAMQSMMGSGPQQQKLQALQAKINASPQIQQLKNNGVIQAQTAIRHQTSMMQYSDLAAEQVGVAMNASLDPRDPVRGSATDSPNTPMYSALWQSHRIVRGHLLNHDLGGFGLAENLFPITSGANSDHSSEVEANVKDTLATATTRQKHHGDVERGIRVNYQVRVRDPSQIANNAFICTWGLVDPVDGNIPDKTVTIPSMATEVRGWHGGGSGKKTAGWAHGARKGDRSGDRAGYAQITSERLTNNLGGNHSSVVDKLADSDQRFDVDPHRFVALMSEYEEIMECTLPKMDWMNWFHVRAESDGGLDEIEEQMMVWEKELDKAMSKI